MPELLNENTQNVVGEDFSAPPITSVVLKIQSRCPLNCGYCYVYNSGDDSWRSQPRAMSMDVVEAAGLRIRDELSQYPSTVFGIVHHGGEPLLTSAEDYESMVRLLGRIVGPKTVLQHSVQTSAVRLRKEHLQVFRKYGIGVGVSLDGDREANDRNRLLRSGASSYEAVIKGIRLMIDSSLYDTLYNGVLSVVDLRNDPKEVYKAISSLEPKAIDLLLPHGNWQNLPPGLETPESRHQAPYGKWLAEVFDAWYPQDSKYLRVKTFDSILSLIAGGQSKVESIGMGYANDFVVINTDGSIDMVDTLASVPGQVNVTGLNVRDHSFRQAAEFITEKARELGASLEPEICVPCPVYKVCRSGYVTHRYSPDNDNLRNNSVFCLDLAYIISHIYGRLHQKVLYDNVAKTVGRSSVSMAAVS
jgi:uncharacterized protein